MRAPLLLDWLNVKLVENYCRHLDGKARALRDEDADLRDPCAECEGMSLPWRIRIDYSKGVGCVEPCPKCRPRAFTAFHARMALHTEPFDPSKCDHGSEHAGHVEFDWCENCDPQRWKNAQESAPGIAQHTETDFAEGESHAPAIRLEAERGVSPSGLRPQSEEHFCCGHYLGYMRDCPTCKTKCLCEGCKADRVAEENPPTLRSGESRPEAAVAWDMTLRCPVCNSNVEGRRDEYHCSACARRAARAADDAERNWSLADEELNQTAPLPREVPAYWGRARDDVDLNDDKADLVAHERLTSYPWSKP